MSQVDQLQNAEEHVAQMREEEERAEREVREEELRRTPLADTATKRRTAVTAPLAQIKTMVNMRVGPLPELDELAISIKETGLLHAPLVRATGEDEQPYELLAGRRRFGAMGLIDTVDGPRDDWPFTLIDGVSRREALTMQFAENFHQSKPEPVQFARAARAIMSEDEGLTAADVSRLVGAPPAWTRKALRLLDLPESIVERVEQGDLSFTVADIVRRGIARGDVSADEAEGLVEQHADGDLASGELKEKVGYVPPPPKNYDELSRQLDESRWAANRAGGDAGMDAEQRDWDAKAGGTDGGSALGDAARPTGPAGLGASVVPIAEADALEPEELDAYVLGLLLGRVASDEQRAVLGFAGEEEAQTYAFSLLPHERLAVIRSMAEELLIADPQPPRALRGKLHPVPRP